jgi:FixJ family two-component response regulator
MKAGAVDYLVKPVSKEELFRSVRRALELDASRWPKRAIARALRQHYATLSGVERDVFVGISNGRINKQLSIDLHVCERTIKSLRAAVMAKMHADSLPSLVRGASVLGLGRALPARDRLR